MCLQSAVHITMVLKRHCLFAVLVICILTVTSVIHHRVSLSPPQTQNSLHIATMSTVLEGCTGEASNRCSADKPWTSKPKTNARPLNASRQRAAHISVRCPAKAVAELTKNVYSDKDRPVRRLPQCIIVGVAKGGTDALQVFVGLHPDVRAANSEIVFFKNRYSSGLEWYRQQMPASHVG